MPDRHSINKSFSLPELLNKLDSLTEENQRLKSKHLNKQKLDAYFYDAPMPLACLNDQREVFFVNRIFLNVLGLKREDVIGKSVCDFVYDDSQREKLEANIEKMFSGEISSTHDRFNLTSNIRARVLFDVKARLVEYDDEIDKAVHLIFQDISEEAKFREAYRNLVENSLQAILIIQDFHIVFANQKAAEISGYSVEELQSLDINGVKKLVHFEDRNRLFDLMKQRLSGKRVSPKQEFRGIRKDGTVYWIEILASFLNYNGKPALQIVQLDISDKKQAETQISLVEHKYRTLVEQSMIGVYVITDGKFNYVNPRFASIFGYSQEEMINKMYVREVVHPDDWLTVKTNLQKRINSEVQSLHYEARGITKTGRTIFVEVHGSRSELDGKISVIGMLQDVTERKETESKLHLQSSALSSAANGIVITNKSGEILYTNPAFTTLTGYSFDEVVGKNPKILKSGKHDEKFYSNIWETVLNGNVWEGEIINKRKDGSEYVEHQTITPVPGDDSDIEFFIAIKSDITESKVTEKALKDSEEKLRNIIEHSKEMFYIHDTKHVLVYVSPQCKELLGFTQEEMKVKWTSLTSDDPMNEIGFDLTQKALATAERQREYVLELEKKDKSKVLVQVAESPLTDSTGKVIGIAGALRDVTEKILAERKLKESEERFRGLYENAILGIYRTSPDGNIIMANPALLKMLGYTAFDEFKKLHAKDALYSNPASRDEFISLISKQGEIYGFETVSRKKDGTKFYIRESAREVKDNNGNVMYYEGILEDITSQKEAEQKLIEAKEAAEKSDALKTDFLAQMSHEIRTPINAIQSFAGLIRDEVRGLISNELINSFSIIDNASRRVIRTIDLILNMSQLQTGAYKMSKSDIDLYHDVLLRVYPELSPLAKEKNLQLEINSPKDLPPVYVDEYSINQIFDNLIHNAIKYTPKGKVEVNVSKNDRDSLIVEVADTGIGISEQYLPNLFKPFTQEEHGYTRKYEGNGLGLALVKRYCDLNDIDISVQSKKGEGTKFTLVFPELSD